MNFGWPEILILLVIVLLLFGVGRVGKIATEMGQGIHNFRKAMDGEKDEEKKEAVNNKKE
jgi:sec-independent protein translocase protein TatA